MGAGVENATRIGELSRALKAEGINQEGLSRGGYAAREVTVDFARSGQWTRQLGKYRAFLNANVQGPDKLWRTYRHRPKRALMFMLSMATFSLALHYLMRDNPDYQERKGERTLYWLIPLGDPRTTTRYFRIRKPHEIGSIAGNLAEDVFEGILANDPKELRKWIESEQAALEIIAAMLPTTILPLAESAFNYDTFRQPPDRARVAAEPGAGASIQPLHQRGGQGAGAVDRREPGEGGPHHLQLHRDLGPLRRQPGR